MKNRQTQGDTLIITYSVITKRNIVYGLIDRTLLLSHPKFHERCMLLTLLNNCFPLLFIFATINTRIKMLISGKENNNDHLSQIKRRNIFTIPYVRSISESLLPITKKYGFDIAYSVPNTLNRFIRRGKDKINPKSQNDCYIK